MEATYAPKRRPRSPFDTPASTLMQAARVCAPDDLLNEPAKLMWESDFGAVPVVNQAGAPLGMITDRDICMAAFARGLPLTAIRVASAMSQPLIAVSPDDSLQVVVELMRERQIRRVAVVSHGSVVGVIALADIARFLDSDGELDAGASAKLARTVIELAMPRTPATFKT